MSAETKVNIRITFFDFIGNTLLLRHTSADTRNKVWFYLFKCLNVTYIAVYPVLSVTSYGTGVKNYKIRFVHILGYSVP